MTFFTVRDAFVHLPLHLVLWHFQLFGVHSLENNKIRIRFLLTRCEQSFFSFLANQTYEQCTNS